MASKKPTLPDQFNAAKARVEGLSARPSDKQLLELYGLYKQATEGDVQGSRPGLLDLKGRFKHDAWAALKGTSRDEAMRRYVAFAEKLAADLG